MARRRRALMMAGNTNSITGEFGQILVEKVVVGANTVANTTEAFRYLRDLRSDSFGYLLAAYRSSTSPAPATNEIGTALSYFNYNGGASLRFWKWNGRAWEQNDLHVAPSSPASATLTPGSVYFLVEYYPQASQ